MSIDLMVNGFALAAASRILMCCFLTVIIVECALSLVLNADALPAFSKRGGVLTPMTAFGDVLIERLKACGRISIESEVIVVENERMKSS
jgi:short subunit dehydrogenase-like uncharacterized protein